MISSKNSFDIESPKIGVLGAGSWGTALANLLGSKGYKVDLWVFEQEVIDQIKSVKENKFFLPGVSLSENLLPTGDIKKVAADKDLLLIVVPSHLMREVAVRIADHISDQTVVVSASKGIENKTHLTMSSVLKEILPNIPENLFAVLSGPSFAEEVARNVPTLVAIASRDAETANFVQQIFSTPVFRTYTNNDMTGVELSGAVKNVIAIASGIVDGLGLGLNTRAALITRGLTEIRRLGRKLGADPQTFSGLAGVGDLMLTCTGTISRNHTIGKKISEGKKLKDLLAEMRMVAEGVRTAKSVYNLSRKLSVEMPISHEVYNVLYNDKSPSEAVYGLMTRDLRHEFDKEERINPS